MVIIQISVAVIAAAFVALVVYLIQTLKNVSSLLTQTNDTIKELQTQIGGISAEATELLRHTNEVTVDVRNKLHSLDPLVYSVKHIGDAVSEITASFKQASATVAGTIRTQVENSRLLKSGKAAGLVQAVPIALGLWERFRNKDKPAVSRWN
ncbi:DUF948 domain-containing protein [Paenibacillus sp. P26]|nr:DUF948 domain-containing protein [Paenibacillus sp. P26]UUZ92302.1 DUF948 domain-containing protein [Paenibacillus sp. P25]